ncbi:serine/threonine-protein kinase [Actinocrispum wychmicini]|uniref:non-specific serine/threonine protein kinase n=1 Tax=Actinocrispum wychmicini TaxID=1213861 RepID=A0A4R2J5I7_9PSEU|nr:serine/threonine-protein kinase [Actinocrispum wychmicini]TCO53594.1 serine/threonine protein kinase [Actinocrispum wychmicini]
MRQIGNGRYNLVRELGRGGMGVVWLAQDTMLGRHVAIKELMVPGGIPAGERDAYRERVLREARIASRLSDPGVVTVYDLLVDDGETYIVMELIEAPTLQEYVEQRGPMPAPEVARLAGQLLTALEVAHDAGVVHRDIKPGNIMVPAKGPVKLTDFGIAQSYEDSRITSTGTIVGSPAYMSPERLEGGDAAPAWDLWALGATLFYAVEGHGAFERPTTTATILAVMTVQPQLRSCTGPLADLINGLLERDPARRIGAIAARDLADRALHPEPSAPLAPATTTARLPSPPNIPPPYDIPPPYSIPPRFVPERRKRRPVGVLVGIVVAVAVIGAAVFIIPELGRAGTPSGQAQTTPTPSTSTPPPSVAMGDPPTTTSTSSTPPAGTPTARQLMTFGKGGDIADSGFASAHGCFKWLPTKGGKGPTTKSFVGCYGPYDVQLFDSGGWPGNDKDIPYPSPDELMAKAGGQCAETLSKIDYPDKATALRYWVLVPSEEDWKLKVVDGYQRSTRFFDCYAGRVDGSKLSQPLVK